MTTTTYEITGLDLEALAALLDAGVDHAGVPVEPFEDTQGGWPLRCCLTDSQVGDRLAIIAFSPFPWASAYRETGPVVVHVDGCPGRPDGALPPQFAGRRQLLRAYGVHDGRDHSQVYDLNRIVEPGGLDEAITALLADARVELLHARNVLPGCYSFTATRR
jgi:hypothetical protein